MNKWWVIVVLTTILAVPVVNGTVIRIVFGPWESGGIFGDSFGAVNSLFSGLALTGILIALFLQRSELRYHREELMLTRAAQEATSMALHQQVEVAQLAAQLNALTTVLEFRRISGMPTEGIPESIERILGELQQISIEE